jgi:DNA-binding transcriptional ArsR family regulator
VQVIEVVAEPTRRRILDLLRERERSVGDLTDELGLAQPAVSKHLRVLRDAGLVEVRVDGPRRHYRLQAAPLAELDDWLAPYRRFWADRLDALEERLLAAPATRRTTKNKPTTGGRT